MATVRISQAAQGVGMHASTLRRLEKFGLITPRRTWAGHRRFSEADLARLRILAGSAPETLVQGEVQEGGAPCTREV